MNIHLQLTDFLIGGGLLGVMVLLAVVIRQFSRERRLQKRIARIQHRKAAKVKPTADVLQLRRRAAGRISPLVAYMLKFMPDIEALSHKLRRGGYTIDGRQYMFRCLLVWLVVMFGLMDAGQPLLIGLGAGFVLGVMLPLQALGFKLAKIKKQFLTLFPDGINLIVRGLRSGLPVTDSIGLVAQEIPAPVGTAFQHAANTMKLGVSMEKALEEVAKTLDYTEFNFFVTSIILQRETGGNLSEILDNLGDVLRKRLMLQLKVKAMTGEARVSSYIIGALPFLVVGMVTIMSPQYLVILYNDPRGKHAIYAAIGMFISGMWIMRRMARFEI